MIIDPKIHIAAASKVMFPLLTGRAPAYDKVLEWFQFAFTGDPKGQYMAPANTSFSFESPVKGGPLFLTALERLQNLYPRAYARGTTATTE